MLNNISKNYEPVFSYFSDFFFKVRVKSRVKSIKILSYFHLKYSFIYYSIAICQLQIVLGVKDNIFMTLTWKKIKKMFSSSKVENGGGIQYGGENIFF
jgi:hypothetical protein